MRGRLARLDAKDTAETRFDALYEMYRDQVACYCRRRTTPDRVDDAVAEVFLTAWRRYDDVPTDDHEAMLWLYGVAHHVVGHQWRSTARLGRLRSKLASAGSHRSTSTEEGVVADDEVRRVLAAAERLASKDVEVLRLVAWEQLSHADAGVVLGIEPNAVKQRLHRARRNLLREFSRLDQQPDRSPAAQEGGAR